jgi:1,4-alpha-glucan branching enzyme
MLYKEPSPRAGHIRVTFEIPASVWADRVYLVGDFNNWDPCAAPFRRTRSGIWRITLDLPARQRFEFRYLIDGQWCTDYHADSCTSSQYQALNSVVETELPVKAFSSCTGHGMIHEAASGAAKGAERLSYAQRT